MSYEMNTEQRLNYAKKLVHLFNKTNHRQFRTSDYAIHIARHFNDLDGYKKIQKIITDNKTDRSLFSFIHAEIETNCTYIPLESSSETTTTTTETTEPTPPPTTKSNTKSNNMDFMEVIAKSFVEYKSDDLKKFMVEECLKIAREEIHNTYGEIKQKITVELGDQEIPMKDGTILHEALPNILRYVNANIPVFITGEAGCGKSETCKQIAELLGLDFYFTNAVDNKFTLTGFTNANGEYMESQFYKAFTNGGLFMLDEIDACTPEALVILNAAIANGYFDFPAPIGYVEKHPNFRVVGAGNTFGEGATYKYVGRNQLDGATLDRFVVVPMTYDRKIEEHVTNNNTELINFAEGYRKACAKTNTLSILSYRALKNICISETWNTTQQALSECLTKSLSKEEIGRIYYNMHEEYKDNKYCQALNV